MGGGFEQCVIVFVPCWLRSNSSNVFWVQIFQDSIDLSSWRELRKGRLVEKITAPTTADDLRAATDTHHLPLLLSILDFPQPQHPYLSWLLTWWPDPLPWGGSLVVSQCVHHCVLFLSILLLLKLCWGSSVVSSGHACPLAGRGNLNMFSSQYGSSCSLGIEKLNVSFKQINGWWIFYRNVFRCWKKTAHGPFPSIIRQEENIQILN